ncbi:hypothetical protein Lal_00020994 [Lupinus albus]|nr:hypothetical protein Lal_00020974 [Lupinus albus]KAF1894702.1 hypothetical protein Lal_00020994 [Lupinus albus]
MYAICFFPGIVVQLVRAPPCQGGSCGQTCGARPKMSNAGKNVYWTMLGNDLDAILVRDLLSPLKLSSTQKKLLGQEGISRKRKRKSHYDAIPMSCSELLPQLVQRGLLTILPFKEVMPPYPNGFNPNACCMYHGGTVGHLTEDCNQLKGKVRELIREGLVKFQGSVLI